MHKFDDGSRAKLKLKLPIWFVLVFRLGAIALALGTVLAPYPSRSALPYHWSDDWKLLAYERTFASIYNSTVRYFSVGAKTDRSNTLFGAIPALAVSLVAWNTASRS